MWRRTSGATAGQMLPPMFPRSGTGDSTDICISFVIPQSTIVTGLKTGAVASVISHPPRNRATSSRGFCVADRPIRCGDRSTCASSLSSVNARCAPRLVPAIAWISSTITARTLLNIPRPLSVVSMMFSDSGVVIRMCGDFLSILARAEGGVSPVRTATRISGNSLPAAANLSRSSASGRSRFL